MELKGTRCVVTGASSGIGMETVRLLAAKGARVLAVARNTATMTEAFQGLDVAVFGADVSTAAGVDQVFSQADAVLGGVDLFLANAGFAYCEVMDQPDWPRLERIFDLNVLSPLYAFQKLRQRKGAGAFSFAVTASAMSHISLPGYAAYGATKAAVHMFGQTARYELLPGQHLMTIHPVATRTKFFDVATASYVPWPTQEAGQVARAIVRGFERGTSRVYPLRLFRVANALFALFPLLRRAYLRREWHKTGLALSGRPS